MKTKSSVLEVYRKVRLFLLGRQIVNETVTETGVLCLICIIHKHTPVTETALLSRESSTKISLWGIATQFRNRGSQHSTYAGNIRVPVSRAQPERARESKVSSEIPRDS